ncbi:MAG: hypothetical protein CME62_04140 [Halobacteriovoraceae bacterium]|nr:hypothetical protein [Halobacteriovoraceae bacterium]|tara:strand:+ start:7392 stop:7928 length:537 start_codon:yes stop_codon:yes gene_type:complete
MSGNDDDDQPTVVIDFNSLKNELNQDEVLTDESEILFKQDVEAMAEEPTEEESAPNEPEKQKKNIYFFDYKSQFLTTKFSPDLRSENMAILTELSELNTKLTKDPECIIVFYYNDHPKVVNQLSGQIKNKFQKAKTVIIAKNLSANKAQAHAKSKYGANAYLSEPFEKEQFNKTLQDL